MKDLRRMRERFLRDASPVRLGNLASDLLRLSKWIQTRHNDEAIVDLMREIAWLMEWTGDLASPELAEMQREICRWRRIWPFEQERNLMALRASQMSNRILDQSGLVDNTRMQTRHRFCAPAFRVHALKRDSQLRADAAREVAHGFVGVFKPELYRRLPYMWKITG